MELGTDDTGENIHSNDDEGANIFSDSNACSRHIVDYFRIRQKQSDSRTLDWIPRTLVSSMPHCSFHFFPSQTLFMASKMQIKNARASARSVQAFMKVVRVCARATRAEFQLHSVGFLIDFLIGKVFASMGKGL
jgi:hypothetical protein